MDSPQRLSDEYREEIGRYAEGFVESLAERLDCKGYLRYKDLTPDGTFAPWRIMTDERFKQTYPNAGELIERLGLWVSFDWTVTWYRLVVLVSDLARYHDLNLFVATRLVSGPRNRELTAPRRVLRGHAFGEGLLIDEDRRDSVIGNIAEALRNYRSEYPRTEGSQ